MKTFPRRTLACRCTNCITVRRNIHNKAVKEMKDRESAAISAINKEAEHENR